MGGHIVEQVRGMCGIRNTVLSVLHGLQVGGGGRSICQRGWRQLFWLVQLRCSNQWDLRNDNKRQDVGVLVLMLIVCDAGVVANE